VAVHCVHESDQLLFISRGGMVVRIRASDVRLIGRNTKGVRVVKLQDGDALMAAARFESEGDEPAGDAPEGDAPAGDAPAGDAPAGDEPAGDQPAGDAT
jgi:DNA gyrase subunit A